MRFGPAAVFLFLAALLAFAPVSAQEQRPPPAGGVLALLPAPATTRHSLELPGQKLDYEAKAGTLSLLGGDGTVTAEVFHVAYTVKQGAGRPARPITFVFNGGPGAASAYLHLGALGPRILVTAANGAFLSPPQRLADNPDTWLSFTDLVFVDPPGTGYSREAPGSKPEDFWGVEKDASAMGAFIRLFLQANGRTSSPVFLAGESYGGFRAALLARTLAEDVGLAPGGLVLISPALDFGTIRGDDFQPLTWALELPSMAAARLAREGVRGEALRTRLEAVERYALGPYLTALAGGLESGGRAASATVAAMTGLPLGVVEKHHARVPTGVFLKEAGRASGEVLSAYDGALGRPDTAPESAAAQGPDAVLDRSVPVLTSAFVAYVRDELGFRTDISYRLLNGEVSRRWDYGTSPSRQGFAGVLDDLQQARALNPKLAVLVAHGVTDLVTPYLGSRFLLSQLPTLAGAEPICLRNYDGGHMMYFRTDARAALKRDAEALIVGED